MKILRLRFPPVLVLGTAAALLAACAGAASATPAVDSGSYRLVRTTSTHSSNTGWDYSSLDEKRGHMFIAHRKDGLQVFDVRKGRVVMTVAKSTGANTSALAPEFDLGISGTTDGEVVLFRLSTLKTIERYKSTTAGFDGATYDPATRQFAMVGETDAQTRRTPVLFFDARTGHPAGSVDLDSEKVDAPRADASGHVYLPLRDRAAVARIDARSLKLEATWPLSECASPASLDLDPDGTRLFVACRGNAGSPPALAVLDTRAGAQVARLAIGRGTDDVFYDADRKRIVTVNGEDGTLTFIRQKDAGTYSVEQTVSTRPMARTGVFDPTTRRIHLVTAEFVQVPTGGTVPMTTFVPDTFVILTYAPAPLAAGEADD
jgi:hypothetical protein